MRFVGNRAEPEEDPLPSLEYMPVTPEFPMESVRWFDSEFNRIMEEWMSEWAKYQVGVFRASK